MRVFMSLPCLQFVDPGLELLQHDRDEGFGLVVGRLEAALELGDDQGNRAGFVLSVRTGKLLRRF